MKLSQTLIYFETEHRPILRTIYKYLIELFPQSITYIDFVKFSIKHSTFNYNLSHLYKQYNLKNEYEGDDRQDTSYIRSIMSD